MNWKESKKKKISGYIGFSPWRSLFATGRYSDIFFGASALSGAPRNFDKKFSEAILFLDLGDQFETLAIIVIFRTSRRHIIATSSLLVACVPRRDLVSVLGSRL